MSSADTPPTDGQDPTPPRVGTAALWILGLAWGAVAVILIVVAVHDPSIPGPKKLFMTAVPVIMTLLLFKTAGAVSKELAGLRAVQSQQVTKK